MKLDMEEIIAKVNLKNSDLKRKFQELRTWRKDRTRKKGKEKYGKAGTLRMAIQLAHQKMLELKKERKKSIKNFKKWERRIKKVVEKS